MMESPCPPPKDPSHHPNMIWSQHNACDVAALLHYCIKRVGGGREGGSCAPVSRDAPMSQAWLMKTCCVDSASRQSASSQQQRPHRGSITGCQKYVCCWSNQCPAHLAPLLNPCQTRAARRCAEPCHTPPRYIAMVTERSMCGHRCATAYSINLLHNITAASHSCWQASD